MRLFDFTRGKQLDQMLIDLKKEINGLKEIQNETIKRYGDAYYQEMELNHKLEEKLKRKDAKIKVLEEEIEDLQSNRYLVRKITPSNPKTSQKIGIRGRKENRQVRKVLEEKAGNRNE